MREGEGGGGDGQTCRAQPQPPGRAWRHLQGAHRGALHGALVLAGRGEGTEVTCDTLELMAGMVVGGESLGMTRSMSSERGWITLIHNNSCVHNQNKFINERFYYPQTPRHLLSFAAEA